MKTTLLALLILSTNVIFSEAVPITSVEMEIVLEIPYGSELYELGTNNSKYAKKKIIDMFVIDGIFFVTDLWNSRLVSFSNNKESFKVINDNISDMGLIDIVDEYILLNNKEPNNTRIIKIDSPNSFLNSNEPILYGYSGNKEVIDFGFTLLDNILIGECTDGTIIAVDIENSESKGFKLLEGEEASNYINTNSSTIKVIDNSYIIYNGQLITKSPMKFFNFNYDKNIKEDINSLEGNRFQHNANFSGIDSSKNSYWCLKAGIFIFNKEGKLIKQISLDANSFFKSNMLTNTIDKEGNIYRLIKSDKSYQIKWIKKTW